jgi:hypothetical protein
MFAAMRFFLATVVLASGCLFFVSDAQNQEPRAPGSAGSQPSIPLRDSDRQRLLALGWPQPIPSLDQHEDALYTRDGQVLSGMLTFLEAFAKLERRTQQNDIAREKVGFVLLAGKSFPSAFAQIENDDDAVVLDSGDIVKGYVNLDAAGVHVKARTFAKQQVTLIHLKGPPQSQYPDIEDPDSEAGGDESQATAGENGGAKKPASQPGRGANEIPWGKALWRGFVRYSRDVNGTTASASYYVTWQETGVLVRSPSGAAVTVPSANSSALRISLAISDLVFHTTTHYCNADYPVDGRGLEPSDAAHAVGELYVADVFAAGHTLIHPKASSPGKSRHLWTRCQFPTVARSILIRSRARAGVRTKKPAICQA